MSYYIGGVLTSLSGLVVASYIDPYESSSLIHTAAYRQSTVELSTVLKLSSMFNYNIIIDALVIDCLEHEFRFTVIYSLQSSMTNTSIRVETKASNSLALLS